MIAGGVDALIGRTPMLEAGNIMRSLGLRSRLLLKLEYLNPTGSVKDRAALYMIDDAKEKGLLQPGGLSGQPHHAGHHRRADRHRRPGLLCLGGHPAGPLLGQAVGVQ